MPRLVYTVLVDDNRANQTTKLDQRVPVAPVARQTRRLNREHGTDATLADRREQPLKARTADARTRAAKIVIDDRHIRPAQSASPFGEAILTPPAFMIVDKLVGGGLLTRHTRLLRDGRRRAASFARHRARGGVRVDMPMRDVGPASPSSPPPDPPSSRSAVAPACRPTGGRSAQRLRHDDCAP